MPPPLIDRLDEIPSLEMYILSKLYKDHCESRILTDRYPLLFGNPGVLEQLFNDLLANRRLLHFEGLMQGRHNVLTQVAVGVDEEISYCIGDLTAINLSHLLSFIVSIGKWE